MAIARKYRRPIQIQGREFLWWVYEDLEEFFGMTLAVASADKEFLVRYQLHQPDDSRYLTVQGREFAGMPGKGGRMARVRCPPFTSGDAVKPADVRRLIEWCLHSERALTPVDWMGREVTVEASPEIPASKASRKRNARRRSSGPARGRIRLRK